MLYELYKYTHIVSAIVLFGLGMGTAFQMWRTHLSGNVQAIAVTARNVVLADWVFTTPAVIAQPLTGALLAHEVGYAFSEPWLLATYALYTLAGLCWLPVVGLQLRMYRLSDQAARDGSPLPPLYHRYFRIWFALGWPAFTAMTVTVALMIFKPSF